MSNIEVISNTIQELSFSSPFLNLVSKYLDNKFLKSTEDGTPFSEKDFEVMSRQAVEIVVCIEACFNYQLSRLNDPGQHDKKTN